MFGSAYREARRAIEELINEIQINLENNYKDLAIGARKKACAELERYNSEGRLKEKDYKRLKETLDGYAKRMEGYHH